MSRFFLTLSIFTFTYAQAIDVDTSKYKSVEQLIATNKIQAKFEGLGGHSGDCMKICVTNSKPDTAFVWVESGRRLLSEDEGLQDIFVVKNAVLAVAPGETDSTNLYGFCCQAGNGGPGEGDQFSVGKMAPRKWVALANFIEKFDFPKDPVQHAVWVLSDGHDIGSITHESENVVAPLKRKVAALLGYKVPWYSITYQDDPERVFSNTPEKITGDIDFYINSHSVVTCVIKNQFGENVSFPLQEEACHPGEYTFKLNQRVTDWGAGKYTIWIVQDHTVLLKKRTFYLSDYNQN